jgi:MFS family permease
MQSIRNVPRAAWFVLLHAVLFGLGMSFFDVLFNFFLVSRGFGSELAGILSTTMRVAGLIVGVPAGILIDRYGSRRSLAIAMLFFAATLTWQLYAPSVFWIIVTQFLNGCCAALAMTAIMPLLTATTDDESQRGFIFGLNEASISIGLIGGIIAGWMPSVLAPMMQVDAQSMPAYRSAMLFGVGLFYLSILPILFVRVTEHHEEHARDAEANAGTPQLRRQFLLYGVPNMLMGLGGGAIIPFQSLLLRNQFGLPDQSVGVVISIAVLAIGCGALLSGHFLAKRRLRFWVAALRALAGPGVLLILAPWQALAIVGYVWRAFSLGMAVTLSDLQIMRFVKPKQRGVAMSMITIMWSAGWGSASLLSGFVQPVYGFAPLIWFAGAAYLCAGIAAWYIFRDDV